MARTLTSAAPLKPAKVRSTKPHSVVSFPVDLPLHVEFDAGTGELLIETPVLEAGETPRECLLRLRFSASACCGFIRALSALDEAGISIAAASSEIHVQ